MGDTGQARRIRLAAQCDDVKRPAPLAASLHEYRRQLAPAGEYAQFRHGSWMGSQASASATAVQIGREASAVMKVRISMTTALPRKAIATSSIRSVKAPGPRNRRR